MAATQNGMTLVKCPRCDALLKVRDLTTSFYCPCGVHLEHPNKRNVPQHRTDLTAGGHPASSVAGNLPFNNSLISGNGNPFDVSANPGSGLRLGGSVPSAGLSSNVHVRPNTRPPSTFPNGGNANLSAGRQSIGGNETNRREYHEAKSNDDIQVNSNEQPDRNSNGNTMEHGSPGAMYPSMTGAGSVHVGSNMPPAVSEALSLAETVMSRFLNRKGSSATLFNEDDGHENEDIKGGPNKCSRCNNKFSVMNIGLNNGRRKKLCRCCGEVVCQNCSRAKWPPQMVPPENNPRKEKAIRVCNICTSMFESFRNALLAGDKAKAEEILRRSNSNVPGTGTVQLYHPYVIYPLKQFPIHCAVLSGNLELVQWLVQNRCNPRVVDTKGHTALTIAATNGHFDICKFLIFRGYCQVKEITDVEVLQKVLQTCFIQLQKMDIQSSIQKFQYPSISKETIQETISSSSTSSSFIPTTAVEEEAQLELAIKMSQQANISELVGSDESANGSSSNEECVICMANELDSVIVPCGHMSCCYECGSKLQECPVCRQKITQIVKTYRT